MLTQVQAGPFTVSGISVGGIYTSLYVKELRLLLDVGMGLRSHAGANAIFLSHGHADHASALGSLLGIRGLLGRPAPRVFMPIEIVDHIRDSLAAMSQAHRFELAINSQPMSPGDDFELRSGLRVRAFRTFHRGPSLGYQLYRRVNKLRPNFKQLPGHEIARRKKLGDDLFESEERLELAYATDTLIRVLDTEPGLFKTRVLILECSFLDKRKSLQDSRAGGHIHLDELLERADEFKNEALVLMHFSQLYSPAQVRKIIAQRCPASLRERIVIFAPQQGAWPG